MLEFELVLEDAISMQIPEVRPACGDYSLSIFGYEDLNNIFESLALSKTRRIKCLPAFQSRR